MMVIRKNLRKNRGVKTMGIAAVTVLALLIAPFCGPICAASRNCHRAGVATAEDCHRSDPASHSASNNAADVSDKVDFAAPRSCNSRDFVAIVSDDPASRSRLDGSIQIIVPEREIPAGVDAAFSHPRKPAPLPAQGRPGSNESVLRI
jgi:hypothetical protein